MLWHLLQPARRMAELANLAKRRTACGIPLLELDPAMSRYTAFIEETECAACKAAKQVSKK